MDDHGLSDAAREYLIDRAVQRRLATDSAYRNAESADEQQAREDEIERECEAAYDERHLTFEQRHA